MSAERGELLGSQVLADAAAGDATRSLWRQAAARFRRIDDTPLGEPFVEVQRRGMTFLVHEEFRDVEADAAGADDRDALADRRSMPQHVDVAIQFLSNPLVGVLEKKEEGFLMTLPAAKASARIQAVAAAIINAEGKTEQE